MLQRSKQPAARPTVTAPAIPMLNGKTVHRRAIGIGMLGMGVVGSGLAKVLRDRAADLSARVGAPFSIEAIAVRDPEKRRDGDLPLHLLTSDADAVLSNPNVDIVVEVIGGVDEALDYICRAIRGGKYVVTANKDVLARHGPEILELAREAGVRVLFEASVGAGTPMVAPVLTNLAANLILAIRGIVNGTSNYILTQMERGGASLDAALLEAQRLGYAETDPTSDVEGTDAARKLAILSSLAWGAKVRDTDVYCEGISGLQPRDFECASKLGYTIKLLALAHESRASLRLRVHPALVPKSAVMASVDGVVNALEIETDLAGPVLFQGAGAGPMPTASALAADIVEVSREILGGGPGPFPLSLDRDMTIESMAGLECRYYLRLSVKDEARALPEVAAVFGDMGVAIDRTVLERTVDGHDRAELVLMTSLAEEEAVQRAISGLRSLSGVHEVCAMIRVEE